MLDNFLYHLAHWNPVLRWRYEAHCISAVGRDFRPEYAASVSFASVFRFAAMALTATADDTTRRYYRLLGPTIR